MAPIVGYWKTSSLAHPIRMILKYKQTEFVNKMYECGPAPDYSRDEWYKEKDTLGLDLPNLPYYIDGDLKITETLAILQYLGRKFNLLGGNPKAQVRNDMVYSFSNTLRYALVDICYSSDFEKLKPGFLEALPGRIDSCSKLLDDRKFFAGDEVTVCDFCMYDVLDIYRNFKPGCLTHDNLEQFMKRMEGLPTVKTYMESNEYMRRPFNNKIAKWGSEP